MTDYSKSHHKPGSSRNTLSEKARNAMRTDLEDLIAQLQPVRDELGRIQYKIIIGDKRVVGIGEDDEAAKSALYNIIWKSHALRRKLFHNYYKDYGHQQK